MQCGFQWSGSFAECSTPPHWGVEGMGLRVGGMGCHLSQRLRVEGGGCSEVGMVSEPVWLKQRVCV